MIRIIYAISTLMLVLAAFVFALYVAQLSHEPSESRYSAIPSVAERFIEAGSASERPSDPSPLLKHAEAFAEYLNPTPPRLEQIENVVATTLQTTTRYVPPVSPPQLSPKFKLHGTIYYASLPERSMALIWEPGSAGGTERWVKEGDQLGYFIIHEIKPGIVVCRAGEKLHELAVEHTSATRTLVRGARPEGHRPAAVLNNIDANLDGVATNPGTSLREN